MRDITRLANRTIYDEEEKTSVLTQLSEIAKEVRIVIFQIKEGRVIKDDKLEAEAYHVIAFRGHAEEFKNFSKYCYVSEALLLCEFFVNVEQDLKRLLDFIKDNGLGQRDVSLHSKCKTFEVLVEMLLRRLAYIGKAKVDENEIRKLFQLTAKDFTLIVTLLERRE